MAPSLGILTAAIFAVVFGIAGAIRSDGNGASAAINGVGNLIVIFLVNWLTFHFARPTMTFPGLIVLFIFDFLVSVIIALIAGVFTEGSVINGALVLSLILLVVSFFVWVGGHNSGHDNYKASHLVPVVVEKQQALPASSTSNLVLVTPNIATQRASQAMAAGIAGQRNYSTYLQLANGYLQMVDGRMWYVFSLKFDGAGNKNRLNGIEPGYIMIDAQDPNAPAVEHYDGQYSMKVSEGGGQGLEPARWAYDHGYRSGLLDDPTLELDDQGRPFYTVTLLKPQLGWTFFAPVSVLVIDAHTGQITQYDIPRPGAKNPAPAWIDRIYSSKIAIEIASSYGNYGESGFHSATSSNANRFQVSGDPTLVYTGDGHPDWRMLLTSYNSDNAVSRILLMDAATGVLSVYTPQGAMGIEDPVTQAFDNASGQGAALIKANHYQAFGLTLHVIYGHLTWMATYEPEGSAPSFVGVGFVDAYHAQADNVAFGSNREQALQNYLQQLTQEQDANGATPGSGGQQVTITGVIAPATPSNPEGGIRWDIQGGTKYYYLTLVGPDGKPDYGHVYSGTSSLGPAIVEAQAGDTVILKVLAITKSDTQQTLQFFSDAQHPLTPAGT